jgi:hypothetical protein
VRLINRDDRRGHGLRHSFMLSFAAQKPAFIHCLAFHFCREQTCSAKQLLKQSFAKVGLFAQQI